MKKSYINGVGCVSAQQTELGFPTEWNLDQDHSFLEIQKPDYKNYFSPIAARRMAKGVKNGIVAATQALNESGIAVPDAIITGTGMGCIEDSDKFLKAILDNNEQFLTPTSFIQSTHNTVASTIAINLGCKGYNFTYVNGAVSFESAMVDAQMQLQEGDAASILVGGVDEMTDYTQKLFQLAGFIKTDEPPYSIKEPKSKGAVFSEGAAFFVLQNERSASTYAEIVDLEIWNTLQIDEVVDKASAFVRRNNLSVDSIDAVILGNNGDIEFDAFYSPLMTKLSDKPQIIYKHAVGEFNTATALGWYVGANILKYQSIPQELSLNGVHAPAYQNILIYNQYRGIDHSFALIRV